MKPSVYIYLFCTTLFLFSCKDQGSDYKKDQKDAASDTTHQNGIPNGRGDLGKPRDTSRHDTPSVKTDTTRKPNN